ncbi:MAG: peptidyl-alpha-hydroxyglycine alpha-amidating lyase family protein [Candidatus Fervidibacter sp.]|uniref:peptidyl-alpha-hydroxyglycine alpha-amidating lyase family protein n=1 Tax=Candidatus Fervidibacter sp. TaxID=3100871 RepID=UPI00404B8EAE
MVFGEGKYTFEVVERWFKPPKGWMFGWIPAVACNSKGQVFVYSRSEHPLIILSEDGEFLEEWGKDILKDAHGIWIDPTDHVYCTDRNTHCIFKFNPQGELVMTLGEPGKPAQQADAPFNKPTDAATVASDDGNAPVAALFVSDGYGNACVHKFTPDGRLIKSLGKPGIGIGEFNLPHCVRVDRYNRVWVCDRENRRVQIFDLDGNYISEWRGLLRPNSLFFDPQDDVVYIAELEHRVSIWTLDGELITSLGSGKSSDKPGEFLGGPHGIWVDAHGNLYVSEVLVPSRIQKFIRI